MRIQIIAAAAAAFTAAISSAALASDAGVVETVVETAYGTAPSQSRTLKQAGDTVQHRELLESAKSGGMGINLSFGSTAKRDFRITATSGAKVCSSSMS